MENEIEQAAQNESQKKMAENNARLIMMANNEKRQKWMYANLTCERYYEDDQQTAKEKKELDDAGIPTFTINMIIPTVKIQSYFLTSHPPKWTVRGRNGRDSDIANIHLQLSDYCFDISNGKLVFGHVLKSTLVKSIGYFHIRVDKNMDKGMGEVLYDWVRMEDVFMDPSARDIMGRDGAFIGIAKNMSKSILKQRWPEFAEKIENASGNALYTVYDPKGQDLETFAIKPLDGEFDDVIAYYEIYRKIQKRFYHVSIRRILTDEQKVEIVKNATVMLDEFRKEVSVGITEKEAMLKNKLTSGEIIDSRYKLELEKAAKEATQTIAQKEKVVQSEVSDMLYPIETYDLLEEEYNKLMKTAEFAKNVIDARPYHEPRIEVTVSVGDDTFLWSKKTNWSEYTIIPCPYMWTGNTLPIGSVKPLIGKQDEINKSHQIMLHHASMSTSGQWLIPSGSIVDKDEWDANVTMPGGKLEYNVIEGAVPQRLSPEPLNNAFFTITQEGKQDFEYISGIWAHMMGAVASKDEPYKLAMARDEFSTRPLKVWITNVLEPVLRQVGKVFKMVAQDTYTTYKVWRITSPTAGQEDVEAKINVPIWNDNGDIVGKWNDYETAQFDIIEVEGSTLPINREAKEEKYYNYLKDNIIDDIAFLPETDIPNKEDILARKSLYVQLENQINSGTEQIKSLNGDNETLRRQVIQGNIALQSLRGQLESRKDVLETEAQQKNLRMQMKNDLDAFKDKLLVEMTKVSDKLTNLEKEKQIEKKNEKSVKK
uniref:Portal protein n=1 Tax=viral metagenome TaxID=1070528 RepID=A0A6M3IF25_9ZZZZ